MRCRVPEKTIMCCDFETTVYDGQTHTEVWAAARVPLYTEAVDIYTNINDFFTSFLDGKHYLLLFHNLKFDGEFILHYLMKTKPFKLAGEEAENRLEFNWKQQKDLEPYEYIYLISGEGAWYNIYIKLPQGSITIWDSLKLVPYSVKSMHKAFNTKHKKTNIEYKGVRYAYGDITPQEKEYIANDVLVVKEAIEYMYNEQHTKMTIGSCCMSEYRKTQYFYRELFPDLTKIKIDPATYGASNADEYIRKAYGGGWCYNKPDKSGKILKNGCTFDANSLYPSQMHSDSGNYYPVGTPIFIKGKYGYDRYKHWLEDKEYYYYIRIKCNFFLKKGYLPFIHIRNSTLYDCNENLETNMFKIGNRYTKKYTLPDGVEHETDVIMTMSGVDFELFKEHYHLFDLKILDLCVFRARKGIFDEYINKYRTKKENAKSEGERTIAKLFLNNLYGKLAASDVSDYKVAYIKSNGAMAYHAYKAHDKKPGHIACGAAITSYARNHTIRCAQANYKYFCYADTDSIHCDCPASEITGIPIDSKKFGCWKQESEWDMAIFVRQKTYVEHIKKGGDYEYLVKCAGMNEKSKKLFVMSMGVDMGETFTQGLSDEELKFTQTRRTLEDFKKGIEVPGKLMIKRMPGGIVLQDSYYKMK